MKIKKPYHIPQEDLLSSAARDGIESFCVGAGIWRDGKILIIRRSIREVPEETGLAVTTTHVKVVLRPEEHDRYFWLESENLSYQNFTPEMHQSITSFFALVK